MKSNLTEEIPSDLNDIAVKLVKLRQQVDPGHVQMIRYLRRTELKLDRLKNDFRRRCDLESGGNGRVDEHG